MERKKLEKFQKRKKIRIERKCEHKWVLDTPKEWTGQAAFIGRSFVCQNCKMSVGEKVASDAQKFKIMLRTRKS